MQWSVMSDHPTCAGCGRTAADRITVEGTRWTPDLAPTNRGLRCFGCRGEPHDSMAEGVLPDGWLRAWQHRHDVEPAGRVRDEGSESTDQQQTLV